MLSSSTLVLGLSKILGFLQVQSLPVLETSLLILADHFSATFHPNPVPPVGPFVVTNWT